MANLFDLISAKHGSGLYAKKRELDCNATVPLSPKPYGKSVCRRPGYKGTDTGRRKSSTDRGHLPKEALRAIGKNDNMAKFDYLQRMTSSFVIPKKKEENKGLLIDLPFSAREWQQDVLPTLMKSYWHQSSITAFSYDSVSSVHNTILLNQYLGRRKELRLEGYSEKEVMDSYGFLYVPSLQEVTLYTVQPCSNYMYTSSLMLAGPSCHPPRMLAELIEMLPWSGQHPCVQVCRYSDILHQQPLQCGQTGYVIIFKVIKGKTKLVSENRGGVYLEPTPNFDCHMVKSNSDMVTDSRRYEQNQIYLYEYGEMDVVSQPRHICPVFVIRFTCKKMMSLDTRIAEKIVTNLPASRLPSHKPLLSRSFSLPANQYSTGPLPFHSQSIMLKPAAPYPVKNQSLPKIPSSSITSVRSEISEHLGTAVWQGDISVKGYLPCSVVLSSLSTNLKPAILGNTINLKSAMKQEDAKNKFLSQIKQLRRTADVFKNKNLYSVCYLKPKGENSVFRGVAHHLKKSKKVGVVRLEGSTDLILIPEGTLSTELGISVATAGRDSMGHLCCIFISPQSRRQTIRSVRLTVHTIEKQNLEVTLTVPLSEICTEQKISHDRGFLPSCPSANLVQPNSLRNLFVEQIVIQRQHDCITETLHVPSRLYAETDFSDVKPSIGKQISIEDKLGGSGLETSQTVADDTSLTKAKLALKTTLPAPVDQSPVILSPDTTFDELDSSGKSSSSSGQSTTSIDNTSESLVSSTVSDSIPAGLTDELAEQIVRAFRIPAAQLLTSDSSKDVNPRDPRKRKHQQVQSQSPLNSCSSFSQEHSPRKIRHFQDSLDLPEAVLYPAVPREGEQLDMSAPLELEECGETDCGKFSPETEENLDNLVDALIEAEPLDKELRKESELDEISTAQDMKKLLDSGLDNSYLKELDLSDEEFDFEPPSLEEISEALDQRLIFASSRNCSSANLVPQSFKPSCNLSVTIKNSDRINKRKISSNKAKRIRSDPGSVQKVRQKKSVSFAKESRKLTVEKSLHNVPSVDPIAVNPAVNIPDSNNKIKIKQKSTPKRIKTREQTLTNKHPSSSMSDVKFHKNSETGLVDKSESKKVECVEQSDTKKRFLDVRKECMQAFVKLEQLQDMQKSKNLNSTCIKENNNASNSEKEINLSESNTEENSLRSLSKLVKSNTKSLLDRYNSQSPPAKRICADRANSTNSGVNANETQPNSPPGLTKKCGNVMSPKQQKFQSPVSEKVKSTVETFLRLFSVKVHVDQRAAVFTPNRNDTTLIIDESSLGITHGLCLDKPTKKVDQKQCSESSSMMGISSEKDPDIRQLSDKDVVKWDDKTCDEQKMFLSARFPGSSCSKTIPAGFFGDSEYLFQRSHSLECQDVMFEEDLVVSELVGNQTAESLLVFLTNVAQKYKHFVGDFFQQAGLEHIIPLTNEFTERNITMGILYSDMTVTIANDCQSQPSMVDLQTCVSIVLHGQSKLTDYLAVEDVVKLVTSVIHCHSLPPSPERLVLAPHGETLSDDINNKSSLPSVKQNCSPDSLLQLEPSKSIGYEFTMNQSQASDATFIYKDALHKGCINIDKKLVSDPAKLSDSCIESVKDIPLPKQKAVPQNTTISQTADDEKSQSFPTKRAANDHQPQSSKQISDIDSIQNRSGKIIDQEVTHQGLAVKPSRGMHQGIVPHPSRVQTNTNMVTMLGNIKFQLKCQKPLNVKKHADFNIPIIPLEPVERLNPTNKPLLPFEPVERLNPMNKPLLPLEPVERLNPTNKPLLPLEPVERLNSTNKPLLPFEPVERLNHTNKPLLPIEPVERLNQTNKDDQKLFTDKMGKDRSKGLEASDNVTSTTTVCRSEKIYPLKLKNQNNVNTSSAAMVENMDSDQTFKTFHEIGKEKTQIQPILPPQSYTELHPPPMKSTENKNTSTITVGKYEKIYPLKFKNQNSFETSSAATVEKMDSDQTFKTFQEIGKEKPQIQPILSQQSCSEVYTPSMKSTENSTVGKYENIYPLTKCLKFKNQNSFETSSAATVDNMDSSTKTFHEIGRDKAQIQQMLPQQSYPPSVKSTSNKAALSWKTLRHIMSFKEPTSVSAFQTDSCVLSSKEYQLLPDTNTDQSDFEKDQATLLELQHSGICMSNKESSGTDLYDPFEVDSAPQSPELLVDSDKESWLSSSKQTISEVPKDPSELVTWKFENTAMASTKTLQHLSEPKDVPPLSSIGSVIKEKMNKTVTSGSPFVNKIQPIVSTIKGTSVSDHHFLSSKANYGNLKESSLSTPPVVIHMTGVSKGNSTIRHPNKNPLSKDYLESRSQNEQLANKTKLFKQKIENPGLSIGSELYDPFELSYSPETSPQKQTDENPPTVQKPYRKVSTEHISLQNNVKDTSYKTTSISIDKDVLCESEDPNSNISLQFSAFPMKIQKAGVQANPDLFNHFDQTINALSHSTIISSKITSTETSKTKNRFDSEIDYTNFKGQLSKPCPVSTLNTLKAMDLSSSKELHSVDKNNRTDIDHEAFVELSGIIGQSGSANFTKKLDIDNKGTSKNQWSTALFRTNPRNINAMTSQCEIPIDKKVTKSENASGAQTAQMSKQATKLIQPSVGETDSIFTQNLQWNLGGIFIPDDLFFMVTIPDDLESFLQRLVRLKGAGHFWSIKVHSHQVCRLASKRHVLNPYTKAHQNASKTLKLLTTYMKFGIVELLKEDKCDLCPTLDHRRQVECAVELQYMGCNISQQAVILLGSDDVDMKNLTRGTTVNAFTLSQLLQFF